MCGSDLPTAFPHLDWKVPPPQSERVRPRVDADAVVMICSLSAKKIPWGHDWGQYGFPDGQVSCVVNGGSDKRSVGIHIPYRFPIEWGASWS